MKYIIGTVLALFLLLGVSYSMDVKLAWDAVNENISGYKVYVGQASRSYGTPITIGTQTVYTVTGLNSAQTYYFAVTAFNNTGNESAFSNEVSVTGTPVVFSKCDLNKDNATNVLDVQLQANAVSKGLDGGVDLNADGQVNVLDLQILVNVVLGVVSCP